MPVYFLRRDRIDMDPERRIVGGILRRIWEGETIIRIYHMKSPFSIKMNK